MPVVASIERLGSLEISGTGLTALDLPALTSMIARWSPSEVGKGSSSAASSASRSGGMPSIAQASNSAALTGTAS